MSYITRSRLRAVFQQSGDPISDRSSETTASLPALTLFQRLATPKRAKRNPRQTKRSQNTTSPSSDQENVLQSNSSVPESVVAGKFESPIAATAPQESFWSGIKSARKRPRGEDSNDRDVGDVEMSRLSAHEASAKRARPLGDVTNIVATGLSPSLPKSVLSPQPQCTSSSNQSHPNIEENNIASARSSKKLSPVPWKLDGAQVVVAEVPTQRAVAVTRLEISKEEQEMNGAPEGDLFEVTVLTDDELLQIESSDEASLIVVALLDGASVSASATWADKFEAITNIRRLLKSMGASAIKSDSIAAALCAVVCEGVESLRSTNVRNALLCLRSLLARLKDVDTSVSRDTVIPLMQSLIRRCHTGARFICEQALDVSREVAPNLPLGVVVAATESLLGHKNAEVSKRAYIILCEAIAGAGMHDLEPLESTLLVVLKDGLKSKSPEVRSLCKQRLKATAERLGEEAFNSVLDKIMSPVDTAAVRREIATPAAAVSSVSSARGVVMANSVKGAPASIKSRFQASLKKPLHKDAMPAHELNEVIVGDSLA